MATPREITHETYNKLYYKYLKKALENAEAAGRIGYEANWLSITFSPCKTEIKQTRWVNGIQPHWLHHYTDEPCDKFCQEKLPMTTCLVILRSEYNINTGGYASKFYTCRHKVGNCPWKE